AEEAAATLGATRIQTIRRVVLPTLMPTILTGSAMAFARAIGEYGSVVFIAGNLPMISEIAPLMIIKGAISEIIGRLPAMNTTEPYSPMARAKAIALPVRMVGISVGKTTRRIV